MRFYFICFLLLSPLIVSVARFHPHMQNKYYSSQNRNKKYAYNCNADPGISKISYFSLLFFRIIRFCLLEYVQSFELNFEQLPAVMEETFFAVPI